MKTRVRARIVGRVQGVGFRPTVYRYATQFGLAGFVCNSPQGVTVEVEGDEQNISAFFQSLKARPPQQAVIARIETETLGEKGYRQFEVLESETEGHTAVHLPPDLATCGDCVRELFNRNDRRYHYPFINCTNCGPRFTIIRDLPYDRDKTSMAGFPMCPDCAREYHEPRDRRFHAQPNACPVCGPRLSMDLADAVALLRGGAIVAVKGLGGYHLACDALNPAAVARLRQRKRRPHKPFAVMFRDVATIRRHCQLSEIEEAELLSSARPVVVLKSTASSLQRCVSPDFPSVGAFLPYTPLHHLLMQHFEALVMTSGNLTDEPIVSDETELSRLDGIADAVLGHNRPIVHKCDDSVLRVVAGQRQFLRRARGFVPNPIRIGPASGAPQILAVGGELKNTFCLVRDGEAFISQHIGDLKDFTTYEYFSREIESWEKLLRVEPKLVAHDLHPAYLSSRFARELAGVETVGVQHHHAHIASVMAEHGLHEPVIGVALDGTGYGTDGTIWGGEFLIADRCDFERVAHFKCYRLPGGDKAIEEPWRMAASVLHAEQLGPHFLVTIVTEKCGILWRMLESGFHAPLTSSAGRLFDAVAALLGLCELASYEAQAAVRLEAIADARLRERYGYTLWQQREPWVLDFGPALRAIVRQRQRGEAAGVIAGRFHNTVAAALAHVCAELRARRRINTVALSGGVFQNALLLSRTTEALRAQRFAVFTNTQVPPNDGGLSLGQAAVALERRNRSCV
jgi:hydrogenase maturation protein HypF